jgi:DNA-binding response OmpR family regulator
VRAAAGAATDATVLVVEDDVHIAELIQVMLAREEIDVSIAPDCATAKEALRATTRDLVLLDLKLPDGSGLDLLRWLRAHNAADAVIVMTAFRQEEQALRAYELGASDFVSKPFRPRELVARVKHALAVPAAR